MSCRSFNTRHYLDHFSRLVGIRTSIERLISERSRTGEIMSEIAESPHGLDVELILKETGFAPLVEINRQIDESRSAIYQLQEAERRRDVSVLGGTYLQKLPHIKRINELEGLRVELSVLGVIA